MPTPIARYRCNAALKPFWDEFAWRLVATGEESALPRLRNRAAALHTREGYSISSDDDSAFQTHAI